MTRGWNQTDLLGSVPARFYMVLSDFVSLHDPYLEGHSQRVAELAVELARRAGGFNNQKLRLLYAAALVHDVGKIGVTDSVIGKPSELSDAERKMIEDHPKTGYSIISKYVSDKMILDILLHHHENMDGSGYPHNLKDGRLSIAVRILRIVDSFDAMTTRRPYRTQLTTNQAIADLQLHQGWYDQRLLNLFVGMISDK